VTSEHAGPQALRKLVDAVLSISADLDLPAVLQRIIDAATDLVDARYGALGVLDEAGTGLAQFVTCGLDDAARARIGDLPKGHGILGLLIVEPRPIRLPDLREHPDSYGFPPNHPPMRSFLGVPIVVRHEVFGNLYLTDKQGAEVFSDIDEELTVALAGAAAVAIENARLHTRLAELVLLEDRERIAKDLHDTVIQRLFATGLSLQGAARLSKAPDVAARIQDAVEDLDVTVKHIRTVIFGLETAATRASGLRDRVLTMVREARGSLGFLPQVTFEGPIDTLVDERVSDELLAALREALANIARHTAANHVDVTVTAGDELVLRISDDGGGTPVEWTQPLRGAEGRR
jgi:signal transduction histidine kinase